MHNTPIFLLFVVLLLFSACEEKSTQKSKITQENEKKLLDKNSQEPINDTFTLSSLAGEYYTVTVSQEKVTLKESSKAIILLSFFSTWCTPCLRQIPYFNDLQRNYKKDLLIAGILIHDPIKKSSFKTFIKNNDINYYLSYTEQNNDFASFVAKTLKLPTLFSIPLTVMYVEGRYFTHYESSVPIEMIEYDIQQAQESLK